MIKAKIEQIHHNIRVDQQLSEKNLAELSCENFSKAQETSSLKCFQTLNKLEIALNPEIDHVHINEATKLNAKNVVEYVAMIRFKVEMHMQQGLYKEALQILNEKLQSIKDSNVQLRAIEIQIKHTLGQISNKEYQRELEDLSSNC